MLCTCQPHPGLNIQIALRFSHIIDNKYSTCSLIVDFTQGLVSLLASSVPECDFDVLVAHLHNLRQKFHPYRCLLTLVELVANIACGDVGFAGASRANDDYFEHLVVVVHWCLLLLQF